MGQGRLAAVEHSVQVHPQHLAPTVQGDVGEQLLPGQARVAHQHVQVAEILEEPLHHLIHLGPLGHIPGVEAHWPPQGPQLLGQGLGPGQIRVTVEANPPALLGKPPGRCRPDPPGGAGDEHRPLRH